MTRKGIRSANIHIRLTESEKRRLEDEAEKSNKNLSDYLIECGLHSSLDTAKFDFYSSINSDLNFLKRTMYVVSKLTLLVVNDQYKDQEMVKEYYKLALEEADDLFK